ncbi:MAG TPA: transglycosylase SLT domain-containing protein [Bacteroidales bacterium]|nr:transglycosylase SLT domain-containing protein [Petrotogaceae bacterium]HQJ20909.1 transglycosylase SLT domain-containing protein [Bacteroidales bacterium]
MDLSQYYNEMSELSKDDVKYLVVHHSATSPNLTIEDIHREHLKNGWLCVGYHAVILQDGTIQYGRPVDSQGAQVEGYNWCSLGVCLIGYFHRDSVNKGQWSDKPTDAQLKSLAELLTNWKRKIPQAKIIGHREVNPTACPGDGFTHLMLNGIAKKVEEALKNTGEPVTVTPSDKKYNELVYKYSQQYNLRPEFVHSIIFQESSYNPKAVSKSNAKGLMQLLPKTWEEVTKKLAIDNPDPFNPEQNIRAGCYYLDWCRKNMNLEWAMAAGYNQGIGNFKKGTMPADGLKYANEVMKRIYVEK